MAHCEYRIPSGAKVNVIGREMSVAASVKPNQSICRVKAEVLDPMPICELPQASTESCPIARFKQGKINGSCPLYVVSRFFSHQWHMD
jgi:hypothetical protein